MVYHFKSLLQGDRTEEITHYPDTGRTGRLQNTWNIHYARKKKKLLKEKWKINKMAHLSPNKPIVTLNMGFPGGSAVKESAFSAGDLDSVPELGRSPGEGKGYPLQYSDLENFMGCIGHEVAKSWT